MQAARRVRKTLELCGAELKVRGSVELLRATPERVRTNDSVSFPNDNPLVRRNTCYGFCSALRPTDSNIGFGLLPESEVNAEITL